MPGTLRGTDGSNPACSSGESHANLIFTSGGRQISSEIRSGSGSRCPSGSLIRRLESVRERLGKIETSLAEACVTAKRIAAKSMERLAIGDKIRTMQQGLAKLGFDPGGVDGTFGPKMRAALEAYQRSRGEPARRLTPAQEAELLKAGAPQEPSGCTPEALAQ
jgi:hypothetical protein